MLVRLARLRASVVLAGALGGHRVDGVAGASVRVTVDLYFIERSDGRRFFPGGRHSRQAVLEHIEALARDGQGRAETLRVGRVRADRIEYIDPLRAQRDGVA